VFPFLSLVNCGDLTGNSASATDEPSATASGEAADASGVVEDDENAAGRVGAPVYVMLAAMAVFVLG
jgi:hypothetical protein